MLLKVTTAAATQAQPMEVPEMEEGEAGMAADMLCTRPLHQHA
jgi:hypothetical protein